MVDVRSVVLVFRDADEVRAAFVSLAESGDRRREIGVASRARAIDHFTWEQAARQVQKIDRDVRARLTSGGAGKL